jgi:hypothetical protein
LSDEGTDGDDESDDESDDGDESDDDNDSDEESDGDDESDAKNDEEKSKIELTETNVVIDANDINHETSERGIAVGEENTVSSDNVDLVAFLLPQTDDKNIDIGIMPINSNQPGLSPYDNNKSLPDSFKQMKVEELRKLIVSKLGMTDDEAKKLKKPQLIQKLSESHE